MKGLSQSQAQSLLEKHGKNSVKSVKNNTWVKLLLNQFKDVMVILLIVSAIIAVAFGYIEGKPEGITDGLVIFGIVILNAFIGFFQEFRTEKALEALQKLVSPKALVIRDGKKTEIDSQFIVPGDIVVLNAGDKITADGFLIQADEIRVNESALTGESVPVHKAEKKPVYMGTSIVSGAGLMEVKTTGMNTEFGKIARLTTQTSKDTTPLQKEMTHIGIVVTKVTLVISAVLLLVGIFFQGKNVLESLLFAVSVAVAAVPEGLPATLTVALALGVQKMVKKQALVKQLSSVETLGSTTVICSDKTGTLTKNQMTVRRLLLESDVSLEVSGSGYNPQKGSIEKPEKALENLDILKNIAQFCNEAELQKKGKHYAIVGDPTEGALLTLAKKKVTGIKKATALSGKVLQKFPFDSNRKMMSVLVQQKNSNLLTPKALQMP